MSGNRYSELDRSRVNEFVDHLLSNPGIQSEPLLISEGMIINFISQNLPQLRNTFRNNHFFPHLETRQVLELIFENLFSRVSGTVMPVITRFIENADFSFFDKLSEAGTVSVKFRREKLYEFSQTILHNRDSRFRLNSVINMFEYNIIEKYIGEIFRRRDFLYNELVRVQKINIDSTEYTVFLKTMLLVKNMAFIKLPINPANPSSKLSVIDIPKNRKSVNSYTDSMVKYLTPVLAGFPEKLIHLSVKSNFVADLAEEDEPAAKFVYIFCNRYHNNRGNEKTERGAESPDKSWFGIARKNAEHFGYDRRMIDALYMIAGDNNW